MSQAFVQKQRFSFGKNWSHFLQHMNEDRVKEAEKSLLQKLQCKTLSGKTFLDIGCGSGLFSLAAHRLGADVSSFDYDPESVKCALFLKKEYAPKAKNWDICEGSVLDQKHLENYQPVDILYSWGVLHHTGDMYKALENVAPLVKKGGLLFLSIYNDQGGASKRWTWIKRRYNHGSSVEAFFLMVYTLIRVWGPILLYSLLHGKGPVKVLSSYGKNNRGMSAWYDLKDWLGGWPFEVAKPEEIFDFFQTRGFSLKTLKTCAGGLGCNEFVFQKL
jgi:2-polyprenyl-3-methyl-5-hydroxy-6-metoxy-1,4-benzoquinol methylase